MKRVNLIIARIDLENVLQVLIDMSCVEASDPAEFAIGNDLGNMLNRELVELDKYNANQGSIALLGTQYTLAFFGWIPAQSEQELTSRLSEYICAWEIEDPSPDELDKVPVKLKWEKFLRLFYKGAGKPFSPLKSINRNEE